MLDSYNLQIVCDLSIGDVDRRIIRSQTVYRTPLQIWQEKIGENSLFKFPNIPFNNIYNI